MRNRLKSLNGFTLIEVIIVVSIISFLVLMGILYLRGQIFKGNDARRKADIRRIQAAVEEFEKDHDCYPPAELLDCDPGDGLQPYLDKIPCDPVTGESYFYDNKIGTCPSWYRLFGNLENSNDSGIGNYGLIGDYNYFVGSPNAPDASLGMEGPGYYGCKNGVCAPLFNRTECSPNYTNSNCSKQCSSPKNECT